MVLQLSETKLGTMPFCSAYLLASGGVNADHLSSTINAVNLTGTFEPLLPLSDTDVEVSNKLTLTTAFTLLAASLPLS